TLMAKAAESKASGNASDCIAEFGRVLSIEPQLVTAYAGRASCYLDQGNAPAAVQDYTRAIALSPSDPSLYLERGRANEQSGNKSAAAADFRKVAEFTAVASPSLAIAA